MPWMLSRYVLGELAKVLLIAASVLVTVIAFGAAIKPLSHDSFLTVQQTLKYITLAIVPMLQFALPFAAGFATTMVFHRLVGDNEILAMRAAGIGYRKILTPIAGLGVLLMVVMVLLTQSIIPNFWELMKRTITQDVTTTLYTTISRGRPFYMQRLQIWADEIIPANVSGEDGPDQRLHLVGVVAAELDGEGAVRTDVTAQQAVVDLYRRDGRIIINLSMEDAVAFNHLTGELISWEQYRPRRPIVVPNIFDNDPRFMSRGELLAMRADPDQFDAVRNARDTLADELYARLLLEALSDPLETRGSFTFVDSANDSRSYRVESTGMDEGRLLPQATTGRVRITQLEDGQPRRIIESHDVFMTPATAATGRGALFDIVVGACTVSEIGIGAIENERSRYVLSSLRAEVQPMADVREMSSKQLLEFSASLEEPVRAELQGAMKLLQKRVDDLLYEISARLARRYTLSVTAFLLLLAGAVLALQLRNAQPLTVYMCAFLPAVFDILLITSGDQMMRDGHAFGVAVMWSGNALLLAVAAIAFTKLMRT